MLCTVVVRLEKEKKHLIYLVVSIVRMKLCHFLY